MAHVQIVAESGCWIWMASLNEHGYGVFGIGTRATGTRMALAHRVSYELYVGPIAAGLVIDHLCRVPACVNPRHLEPVTNKENLRRGIGPMPATRAASAWQRAKTHCPQGHEYNQKNTYTDRRGKRHCITCKRRATQEWLARKRS